MKDRITEIIETIEGIPDVTITKSFFIEGLVIKGSISVFVIGLESPLEFEVIIASQYPFKTYDAETIFFFNKDLLEYSHIMKEGNICIHTAHSPILSQKLVYDVESVKAWIEKYYLNKTSDSHYEHLIVPRELFNGQLHSFLFNEVQYPFGKNQFGYVNFSRISNGHYGEKEVSTYVLQQFINTDKKLIAEVYWNTHYKRLQSEEGLFIFLENPPSNNRRWVYETWDELRPFLPQIFLSFLHSVDLNFQKRKERKIPLFVGYKLPSGESHWQVIMLEAGKFPTTGKKENKQWVTILDNKKTIDWAMTSNCSYKYFYGRGHLNKKITHSKILIIGIGAIGSIIAKTLVRGGCLNIDIIDYDIKEPENVCRSEYSFASGINNKINDLNRELVGISPFVNINYNPENLNAILKSLYVNDSNKKPIEQYLNGYNIIVDCSTDNDLLYILSQLEIRPTLLNISISNHAKQLVCAVEKNRYDFVLNQYENVLKYDVEDLHNPTGCWNPTFRASYNDINVLAQFAIKHINLRIGQPEKTLRNFVLETNDDDCFNINLKEF